MPMEPFETEGNFQEDVGLFEAAAHGHAVELPAPELSTIHLAVDGSNQDATARTLATILAESTRAVVHEFGSTATARTMLDSLGRYRGNALVLPVPFGENYDELAHTSLGPTVDVLLGEASCPLLCVREALDESSLRGALAHLLVPVLRNDEATMRALGWAFRVVPAGGRVELVAVADPDVLAESRHLSGDPSDERADAPAQLTRHLLTEIGPIVATAQHQGTSRGIAVHVESRVGRFAQVIDAEARRRPRLIVWGTPRDRAAPAFHRAVDLILASRGPVLVV